MMDCEARPTPIAKAGAGHAPLPHGRGSEIRVACSNRPADPSGRTLGIDPGLARTGYAVIEDASRRVIEAGVVRCDASLPLARRLAELARGIDEILDEHPVARVAVEDLYAHYNHPRTAILMGHARGVILLAAARRGIPVETYAATRIKKSLTHNGHASKTQMQRAIMASLRLPRLPEPPDVADAMAAALCAIVDQRRPGLRGRM